MCRVSHAHRLLSLVEHYIHVSPLLNHPEEHGLHCTVEFEIHTLSICHTNFGDNGFPYEGAKG